MSTGKLRSMRSTAHSVSSSIETVAWSSVYPGKAARPVATASVLLLTAVITGLQFRFPEVLSALRRTPWALSSGEWWRLITPLFVHPDGWSQITFDFIGIAIVGTVVERIFGARRWLILYFSAGLVGEVAGFAWEPFGAGSSVGGAGLLGAFASGSYC